MNANYEQGRPMNSVNQLNLDDHYEAFVEQQVASGNFANATEVMQAALKLLEAREAKREVLRQALIEGEQSGLVEDFHIDDFLAEMDRKYVNG